MDHHHFLSCLFAPAGVALIVGDQPPAWVLALTAQLAQATRATRILRLADGGPPADAQGCELVLIALDKRDVAAAIDLAAGLRARVVSVMTDDRDAADASRWREQAQRLGLRLLGPGTMGFVRPALRLNAGRMGPLPNGGNVALVSQSGVINGAVLDWVADSAVGFSLVVSLGAEADIDLARLSAPTLSTLAQALPGCALANPLNLRASASAENYGNALAALAADREIDGVLVMLAPVTGIDGDAITRRVIDEVTRLRKPVFACWMGDRGMRPLARLLAAAGVPVYSVPEAAIDAYAIVANFHQNQRLLQQTPLALSNLEPPDLDGARALIADWLTEQRVVLSEMQSKALLTAFHVPVTATMLARSPEEAVAIAERMGFPVVMKINAADVSHKSDVGGVVLNVRNAAEVREQYGEILAAVARAQPGARIDGVTLQTMRRGRHGRELYIGVFRDPLFGPAIDFEPLEALLVAVSEMVCELPSIAEMDINPVIVDENGLLAVDARMVLDPVVGEPPPRHSHLAIMPYPSHLTRVLTTPDGASCTLRAIAPEDADRLQAFVKALSAESRYFRFISVLAELPPRMLVRYTQIDYDRELALVAVTGSDPLTGAAEGARAPDGQRIVAVVRYLLNIDRDSCEFAIAIADDWQGKRLGSTMMRAIIEAARRKKLRRIEGFVLSTNSRMLALMRHLGFTIKTDPQDTTMKLVWIDLAV